MRTIGLNEKVLNYKCQSYSYALNFLGGNREVRIYPKYSRGLHRSLKNTNILEDSIAVKKIMDQESPIYSKIFVPDM